MKVEFLAQARHDLGDIWTYVAAHDVDAADRLIDRFYAASGRLSNYPRSGPARPEIGPDVRSLTVGQYLLLYRVGKVVVEVVRVMHSARDLLAALGEPE